jgi:hypothetical protein
MSSLPYFQGRETEAVDYVFSNLSAENRAAAPVPPSARLPVAAAPAAAEASDYEPSPPPGEANLPPQMKAAHTWLRQEKARLEAYTRSQLHASRPTARS